MEGLLAFLEFAGKAPLVRFDAGFDDALIRRAMQRARDALGAAVARAPAQLPLELLPEEAPARRHLDAWLERLKMEVFGRRRAAADALATAQLLLALLPRAAARRLAISKRCFGSRARGAGWEGAPEPQ